MNTGPLISDKDVRDEVALLARLGWEFVGFDGNEHIRLRHPEVGAIALPSSPSSPLWRKAKRGEIARRMGIPTRELVERMTGERVKVHSAAERKRRRRAANVPRRSRALASLPQPKQPVAPARPLAPRDIETVVSERQAARAGGDAARAAALSDELDALYAAKRLRRAAR
jgi:hypothetical protein